MTAANIVGEMAAFYVITKHTRACLLKLKRDIAHVVPLMDPYALVALSPKTGLNYSKDRDTDV